MAGTNRTSPAPAAGDAATDAVRTEWQAILNRLDHAFHPIVQLRSGRCHGYEALLRGIESTEFSSISALFDAAWTHGVLGMVETELQARAITRFRRIDGWQNTMLFVNIDARAVGVVPPLPATERSNINVVLEITERREAHAEASIEAAIESYRRARMSVALDDFGVGHAGLKLLYEAKPDYVKVDRFFISGIDRDVRRRSIAQYFVNTAHALGILTVAEGIETETEFYTCRDLGFDFGQGFLIADPLPDLAELPLSSPVVERLNRTDRRRSQQSHSSVRDVMERLPSLPVTAPKTALLAYFAGGSAPPVAPVVDAHNRPLGMVRERDMKRFTYSRFGGELLRNKEVGNNLADLVTKAPVCDVMTSLDQIVEAFSVEAASDGIIFIENGEYVGFLSPAALIRLVHEHNLARAADQNPLSRLPGNAAIVRHIQQVLADPSREHCVAYFDFDNFKPFNDAYGFRQGDRAILMFADRLKAIGSNASSFAGHIGGDDFFVSFSGLDRRVVLERLVDLAERFRSDAEALYDPETRRAGFLLGKDRDGNPKSYPLLTVTGSAVIVPSGQRGLTTDAINDAFAAMKTNAKRSPERVSVTVLAADNEDTSEALREAELA